MLPGPIGSPTTALLRRLGIIHHPCVRVLGVSGFLTEFALERHANAEAVVDPKHTCINPRQKYLSSATAAVARERVDAVRQGKKGLVDVGALPQLLAPVVCRRCALRAAEKPGDATSRRR